MAIAFFNPVSDDFHIKLCSATTLDEQVDVSTDHIHEFLFIITETILKINQFFV